MPVPTIFYLLEHGPPQWLRDRALSMALLVAGLVLVGLVKRYTSGRSYDDSTPLMHGKVVIMTGATSGLGAEVAFDLAKRGAQLVLLTHAPTTDPFLADFVHDLRHRAANQLVHAEHVDLACLHSIRRFATAWIDNAPPRRLDLLVLCAAVTPPPGSPRRDVGDHAAAAAAVEETWMVNFLANFHLLGLLSPAIRAQPPDRDVRVVLPTCSAYIASPSLLLPLDGELKTTTTATTATTTTTTTRWTPSRAYSRSKLALNVFGVAYQKHLDAYPRPDGMPVAARVVFADPGLCRTPGMLRWLTRGSLVGLALYLVAYALPWLLLKSARRGAQSILCAAMEPRLATGPGGRLIKDCVEVDFARTEVHDDEVARRLWQESDALIEETEKKQAKLRAWRRKEEEEEEKQKEKQREEQKDKQKGGKVRKRK